MLASSRISSRSSRGRLCASSTISTVDSPAASRRVSASSSSSSSVVFDSRARSLSSKRSASISTNSSRVSAGFCRCTQCTRAGCRSSAVRISVVLPVPASPMSSVMPVRLAMPYSRLLSASRWTSVSTRKRGFGVRSNGRSRKPKNDSYISATSASTQLQPPHDHHRGGKHHADDRRRRRQQQLPPPERAALDGVGHHRDDGQHRQRQRGDDVVVGLEARVAVLEQRDEAQPEGQAAEDAQQVDPHAIGADRAARAAARRR